MASDFTGRMIEAGQLVVYPVRRGSAMWLNKLIVTQVDDNSIQGFNATGRLLRIKNLKNVVIIPKMEGP